jgi:NADH:ubiquinone reductase (H+-translocating)
VQKRILVVGSGFAGMWGALAAARLLERKQVATGEIEVALVAPKPMLTVRPRLYEAGAANMAVSLRRLFDVTGIRYVQGTVNTIYTESNEVDIAHADGTDSTLSYESLVLATGSRLFRPRIPGLRDHAFSIDQIDEAAELEGHCRTLTQSHSSNARNTAVVGGGGFTGIEIAAELPARLRSILGEATPVRVVVVERASDIGPDLGPGPRPIIQRALAELGVECRLGVAITAIDANGVTLSNGERIESHTVVWTAGLRASALTEQIPGKRDSLGRLHVDRDLRVPTTTNVFATGDTACAATDEQGHYTLMSCQHALDLGRFAGNNAAAILLGVPTIPYSQPSYVTGLDLGPWGAVHTIGWDRRVVLTGEESKTRKQYINSVYIYPPRADRAEAFAAADPVRPAST